MARGDQRVNGIYAVGATASAWKAAYDRYHESRDAVPLATEAGAAGGLIDHERQPWESIDAYRARMRMDTPREVARRREVADRELLREAWDAGEVQFSQAELVILAKHVLPSPDDPHRWSRAQTCHNMRWSEPTLRKHTRRAREKARRWKAAQPA